MSGTEIAASRLLHALGFGADRVSRVETVRCYGCPFQPFHSRSLWEHATRSEVDALRLMAIILHHWDNKTSNQRLTCVDSMSTDCRHPLAMIQDVGSDFGPRKMKWMPYKGGTFEDVKISEEGRRLIGDRLTQLSRGQIEALFAAARLDNVPEWVAAFEDKLRQIADRLAHSINRLKIHRVPGDLDQQKRTHSGPSYKRGWCR